MRRRSLRRTAWIETPRFSAQRPGPFGRRSLRRTAWIETLSTCGSARRSPVAVLFGGRRGLKHLPPRGRCSRSHVAVLFGGRRGLKPIGLVIVDTVPCRRSLRRTAWIETPDDLASGYQAERRRSLRRTAWIETSWHPEKVSTSQSRRSLRRTAWIETESRYRRRRRSIVAVLFGGRRGLKLGKRRSSDHVSRVAVLFGGRRGLTLRRGLLDRRRVRSPFSSEDGVD